MSAHCRPGKLCRKTMVSRPTRVEFSRVTEARECSSNGGDRTNAIGLGLMLFFAYLKVVSSQTLALTRC